MAKRILSIQTMVTRGYVTRACAVRLAKASAMTDVTQVECFYDTIAPHEGVVWFFYDDSLDEPPAALTWLLSRDGFEDNGGYLESIFSKGDQ